MCTIRFRSNARPKGPLSAGRGITSRLLRQRGLQAADSRLDTGGWSCGKDGQAVPVSQGLPTVLVSGMTVGGENA